jgi:protein tyrosine phosphatase
VIYLKEIRPYIKQYPYEGVESYKNLRFENSSPYNKLPSKHQSIAESINASVISTPGYESDDLAYSEVDKVYLFSGDRD